MPNKSECEKRCGTFNVEDDDCEIFGETHPRPGDCPYFRPPGDDQICENSELILDGIQAYEKMYREQNHILIESMREVKKELGMLGVRAVNQFVKRLKEDCLNVWCIGIKNDTKSYYSQEPKLSCADETPLTVYDVSEREFEDGFRGTVWVKIKNEMFLAFDYNG